MSEKNQRAPGPHRNEPTVPKQDWGKYRAELEEMFNREVIVDGDGVHLYVELEYLKSHRKRWNLTWLWSQVRSGEVEWSYVRGRHVIAKKDGQLEFRFNFDW